MKALLLFLSLILAAGIVFIGKNFQSKPQYSDSFSPREAFNFELGEGDKKVALADFKGKNVILYFGFTFCPDVCPMSISFISKVLEKVDDPNIVFIFVSVDYKRDTLESVSKYVTFYNPNFIGLTGTQEQINNITQAYDIFYRFINMPKSQMKYTVDHTSRFIMIDKNQKWVDSIHSESNLEDAIERIKSHL